MVVNFWYSRQRNVINITQHHPADLRGASEASSDPVNESNCERPRTEAGRYRLKWKIG